MIDVVFDMETQDPDDFLTLLLLLGHPRVRLKAVTITPGTPFQVAFVRRALSWFEADIPVGAHDIGHLKGCISSWHYRAYGLTGHSTEARPGGEVLVECCDEATTLVTGGPLKNLGDAMSLGGLVLGRWVAQGGFAGEGVVPPEAQLEKFRGMRVCPTFNLNGDPRSALRALDHPGIGERRFVSKNVCHGVVYDEAFHAQVGALKGRSASLALIWKGMEAYLARKRHHSARVNKLAPAAEVKAAVGKKLHDPLAACCAIDPEIGRWAEVRLFREKGLWGSRLCPGSGTRIIVGYDRVRFIEVFTESAGG